MQAIVNEIITDGFVFKIDVDIRVDIDVQVSLENTKILIDTKELELYLKIKRIPSIFMTILTDVGTFRPCYKGYGWEQIK